ncbi:MAG: NAD(P)/FAD-dependent oxidoreductase [Chloroflexota bacterium]
MTRVLILGGGYGGVQAGLTLNSLLRKRKDVEIVLVDRNDHHTLLTELHEIAGNRTDEDAVLVPLHDIFQYTKVKVVRDEIVKLDCANKALEGKHGKYDYDYLVMAGGSRPNFFGIPGLEVNGLTLWSHKDAIRAKEHIRKVFALASQTKDPAERKRLLTLVVGGGGFTGVELIGELARYRRQLCHEFNVDIRDSRLILVEAMDKILTVLSKSLADKGMAILKKIGVEVMLNSAITNVTPDHIELKNGQNIETRTLIWTGGVQACKLPEGTEFSLARRGRIPVNKYLQCEQYPEVYVVGDLSCWADSQGKEMPALVESALQSGECAAENIVHAMDKKPLKEFKLNLHGVMVCIGRWNGVADVMGMKLTGFLAIVMKHMVNLHYLFGIGGVELCIRYLKHEFLSSHFKPGLIEEQFTNVRPMFWLVPLRLYIGYMWITEAINKLNGGWWNNVIIKAADAGAGASSAAAAAAAAPAAVAGASAAAGAAAAAAPAATAGATAAAGAAGAAGAATGGGMALIGAHTPGWYAWIVNTFIYPNPIFFQRAIVITEMLLGVLLVIGLFTFIAGVIGVIMNINFILSTGVYDYWFLVVSIAVMAGAGMSFGADKYVMPWLMRQWRYFVRNKGIKLWLWDSTRTEKEISTRSITF